MNVIEDIINEVDYIGENVFNEINKNDDKFMIPSHNCIYIEYIDGRTRYNTKN